MANWEQVKNHVKSAASKAMKTTEELADSASMQVKLKSLESKRDKKYTELGRLTYRQIKTEESMAGKISPIIEELDQIREQIKEQTALIEQTKKDRKEAKKAAKEEKKNTEEA